MVQGRFGDSRIDVECCTICAGQWFDATELQKVVAYLGTITSEEPKVPVASDYIIRQKSVPPKPTGGWIEAIARRTSQRYRLLSRVPTFAATVNRKDGFGLVEGRVSTLLSALTSPVTQTECACYRSRCHGERHRWKLIGRQHNRRRTASEVLLQGPKRIGFDTIVTSFIFHSLVRLFYRDRYDKDGKVWRFSVSSDELSNEWHSSPCLLLDERGQVVAELELDGAEFFTDPQVAQQKVPVPEYERYSPHPKRPSAKTYDVHLHTEEVFVKPGDYIYVLGEFWRRVDGLPNFHCGKAPVVVSTVDPSQWQASYRRRVLISMVAILMGLLLLLGVPLIFLWRSAR